MKIFICLLFTLFVCDLQSTSTTDLAIPNTNVDTLTGQSAIDDVWEQCLITAPGTINLLGQVMVVASKVDVSFDYYSPNYVYKYIKYPKSFRATLLHLANEGYSAFLDAHSSMNRIQLYMRQIPQHIRTMIKALSSKTSPQFVSRLIPARINTIERISQTCVSLANSTEKSFKSVKDLLNEILEATQVTKGLHEGQLHDLQVELNVTRVMQAEMKREEEVRRQHYEEIRQAVHKAQAEYSKALDDIPTGWDAVFLELGRAVVSVGKSLAQGFIELRTQGLLPVVNMIGSAIENGKRTENHDVVSTVANTQTINFAAHFAKTLDLLIENLTSSGNETRNNNDLRPFKVVFGAFFKMINTMPDNKAKNKAINLIQRAIQLVDNATKDKDVNIKDDLEKLAEEIQPFTAAAQLSPTNRAPISASDDGDLSKNELFKARLVQARLSEQERRLDQQYAIQVAAMEQMRAITVKLSKLDLTVVNFEKILAILKEAFLLLGKLQKQWHYLVVFFTDFAAQVHTSFYEHVTTFINTTRIGMESRKADIERTLILEILNGDDSINLHREAHLLYILSRTYYDVSKKYLMPRLAGLSLMLAADNDNKRTELLVNLQKDTDKIQGEVSQIIRGRKLVYRREINKTRAEFNEKIDDQGADGNELDVIEEAKKLLAQEDTLDE